MRRPPLDPAALDAEADHLDPETIDTGEPIAQLVDLEATARPGFLGRLRRRIDRRRFAGDATTFAWTAPWVLLRELLQMLFAGGHGHREDGDAGEPTKPRP